MTRKQLTIPDLSERMEMQVDELLQDEELMAFLKKLCSQMDTDLGIYISFLINKLDNAFIDSRYKQLEGDEKAEADGIRKNVKLRPTLHEMVRQIREQVRRERGE